MPVSARAVAAALRRQSPGLGVKKLHKLLYYCQGHHLATFGRPLFVETVSAWDMGPVVGSLWFEEKNGAVSVVDESLDEAALDEAALNTVGYVVSRYGRLSGRDLEVLSHSEDPWQRADRGRRPGGSARIEPSWLREFFASAPLDDDEIPLDAAEITAWLSNARERLEQPAEPDDLQALRSRFGRA